MKQYKFLGITDEVTECGLCGKQELKGTKILQDIETNEVFYFGSTCGASALGWTVKDFNKTAKTAQREIDKLARAFEHHHPLQKEITRIIEGHYHNGGKFVNLPHSEIHALQGKIRKETQDKYPTTKYYF